MKIYRLAALSDPDFGHISTVIATTRPDVVSVRWEQALGSEKANPASTRATCPAPLVRTTASLCSFLHGTLGLLAGAVVLQVRV
jgi:hypothetical protein